MSLSFLTIKEPCYQGWENMSVSEKGRFCSSCQKQVHDFTHSTIDQIKKVYSESEGGLCGHIPVKLLQEQYIDKNIQTEYFSYLKKFWIAAVFCFGSSLFTVDAAQASTFYKIRTSLFNFVSNANDSIVAKGVVKDKATGEKLPFVSIYVMHNDSIVAKCVTDIEGKYEVKIPKEYSIIDIKAMYLGYVSKMMKGIPVAPPYQPIKIDFDLEIDERTVLDGMIIMQDEPKILEPTPSERTFKREEYKSIPK